MKFTASTSKQGQKVDLKHGSLFELEQEQNPEASPGGGQMARLLASLLALSLAAEDLQDDSSQAVRIVFHRVFNQQLSRLVAEQTCR